MVMTPMRYRSRAGAACVASPAMYDWYAGPELNIDYRHGLDDGVQGCRIAYSRTPGYGKPDHEVVRLVDKAVEALADLGAQVEEHAALRALAEKT
jgi:aspartyl-tRNA(Asn)/glutamyl-tRNA(Gln) amidotransferase subunit A